MSEYCQNCGAELKENSKFCQECGHEIGKSIAKTCPNCGEVLEDSINFCENCGTNLNTPETVEKADLFEKYRIPILIVAIIAVIIVTFAGASFLGDIAAGSQTIEIDSMKFSIPANFKASEESTIPEEYGGVTQLWKNGDETIEFWIDDVDGTAQGNRILNDLGGSRKEMYGFNGYYNKFTDGGCAYSFVYNNKICHIIVSDDKLLNRIDVL